MTFQALAAAYFEQHLSKKSSYSYYLRLFRQYFADWTEHKTRFEIKAWHLALSHTPTHANKGLGFLKAMYAWGQNTGDKTGKRALWEGENPARGVRRHGTNSRERVASDLELIQMFTFLEFCHIKLTAFITVLLCTGCRMSEARMMKWVHLDFKEGLWYKPHTKNGTSHMIPLTRQVIDALQMLPRQGDYVFMGLYGRCWSRAAAEKAWGIFRKGAELKSLRLHDFRRTVGSRVYEQTKDMVIVKAILNHRPNSITEIYMRTQYPKIKQALQDHADIVWALKKEVPYVSDRHTLESLPTAIQLCRAAGADTGMGTAFDGGAESQIGRS